MTTLNEEKLAGVTLHALVFDKKWQLGPHA